MHDLILTTQNKSVPAVRDIQPIRRPSRPKVHTFQFKVDKGTVTADLTGDQGAFLFALSDSTSPTDYTSLFDQYRIIQVQVEFLPVVSPFGASTTATDLPVLITKIDYDDATSQSYASLLESEQSQVVTNMTYHCRTLTPQFALSAYGGAFGSFASSSFGQWVDSASPGVQYYGLKWATSPVSVVSGTYVLYRAVATYTLQCRAAQ